MNMHRSDCGLQFTSSTPILTPKDDFEKTERELLIIVLFNIEMKKFIKIHKAILHIRVFYYFIEGHHWVKAFSYASISFFLTRLCNPLIFCFGHTVFLKEY